MGFAKKKIILEIPKFSSTSLTRVYMKKVLLKPQIAGAAVEELD